MRRIARFIALAYFVVVAVAAMLQVVGITRFSAPLDVLPTPQRPPVVVSLSYSSEQQEWLTAAAQQFAATGPTLRGRPIQLALQQQGSQAMIDGIVQGQSQPIAIIPAGNTQLAVLNRNWSAQHPGAPIVAAAGPNKPLPVALSPLVLVGWKERVDRLFPDPNQDLWRRLHDALQKSNWGDPALGGDPQWGPVKFGHASPLTANSGIETLVLLAYAYHNKAQNLTLADVNDPTFQSWLKDIESGVTDFPSSSEALFNAFLLKGPSAYDVAAVYENQVVHGLGQARLPLRVLYPRATTWSDHPFTVLEASWSTPEQQEAARMFRDYLLTEPVQQLALQYGFRPANNAVSLKTTTQNNPFPAAASVGVQQDVPGAVAPPSPEVLDALAQFWEQQIHR